MPRCLACNNMSAFRRTVCRFRVQNVIFDQNGNVIGQCVVNANQDKEDTWPWMCDKCGSENVDIPAGVSVD